MIKVYLSRLLGEQRITMAELSRRSGISKTSLVPIYHEESTAIKFDTLEKICKALDCTVDELLEYIP